MVQQNKSLAMEIVQDLKRERAVLRGLLAISIISNIIICIMG